MRRSWWERINYTRRVQTLASLYGLRFSGSPVTVKAQAHVALEGEAEGFGEFDKAFYGAVAGQAKERRID